MYKHIPGINSAVDASRDTAYSNNLQMHFGNHLGHAANHSLHVLQRKTNLSALRRRQGLNNALTQDEIFQQQDSGNL